MTTPLDLNAIEQMCQKARDMGDIGFIAFAFRIIPQLCQEVRELREEVDDAVWVLSENTQRGSDGHTVSEWSGIMLAEVSTLRCEVRELREKVKGLEKGVSK